MPSWIKNADQKRSILTARQWMRCFYCGRTMVWPTPGEEENPLRVTLDHIKPRSAGGTGRLANLVAACLECNRQKADMRLTEEYESKAALARALRPKRP